MVKLRFYDPDEQPVKTTENFTVVPAPKRGINLDWIHEFSWRENPFTTTHPLPAHQYFVGQDAVRSAINLFFIKEQTFGTISGPAGSGKTYLLQWVSEELAPYSDRYAVVRVDAQAGVQPFVNAVTQPWTSFFTKYKGSDAAALAQFLERHAKKRLVLLIDNGDTLGELTAYVQRLREQNGAVVLIGGVRPQKLADDALAATLAPLSADLATKLVEKRIERVGGSGIVPFNDHLLSELWSASKSSPVQFLDFCNETAMKIALKQVTVVDAPIPGQKKQGKQKSPYDDLISDLMQ